MLDRLFATASLLYVAKELFDNSEAKYHWKDLCDKKEQELREEQNLNRHLKEEVYTAHNNVMALMKDAQQREKEFLSICRAYTDLCDQLESLGLTVDEQGNVCYDSEEEATSEEEQSKEE